ncbi:histidine kinase [Christiangramia sp. SM2212]|uniref:Histidine kinase n=1 Tax=Christiangramia sediminicola TaxID=3073267 RepID=A0ABU1EP45_9FLAO|nr:histidine kinase [Christiangramia sp. SM2212]MDR5589802.1 histidine kinase [Christiangramia sp. SM2212]
MISQNFPGRKYTASEELPNNTVRSLLVDSDNILWIGTDNGVVKKENEVYQYFFEEDGLALNSCWAIAEDSNKHLWFGSYGNGISFYDGNKFKVISKDDGIIHNEITELFPYQNRMYVGTSDGISRININNFEVESWVKPSEDTLMRITGFFEDDNYIYVTTYNTGVFRILDNQKNLELEKISDHKFIYSVFRDSDSIYSSNKGYFERTAIKDYLDDDKNVQYNSLGKSILWDYVKTSDHKIFVAAWGIYDNTGGLFELVDNGLILKNADFHIPSTEVISLAYDPVFENLFVGTRDAGLYEIKLNSQIKFNQFPGKEVIGFANTSSSSAVLLNDEIVMNSANREFSISRDQLKNWQQQYVSNTNIPLPKHEDDFYELDYEIQPLNISFYDLKVFEENYWLNTNIGIFTFTDSGDLVRYLPLHSEEINFTASGELVETHPYGGARIYTDLDKFKYDYLDKNDPATPTMVVNSLKLSETTYFTSVFSGLYKYENEEFRSYLQSDIWEEERLRHISALGDQLAVSTDFGDVYILNDSDSFEIFKKIPRANIAGNSISFLKEYNGSLIIGTEKGLTIYKDDRYILLDEEQGLKQPLLSAAVNGSDLKIGSKNGYYVLDLKEISKSVQLIDNISLKEVFINNHDLPTEKFKGDQNLKLPYDENTLLINFRTNSHPFPNKLAYQYRLKEDGSWSLPNPDPEIFLPFLPSGNYNVEIRVLDKSTGFHYSQKILHLSILPPFWKTWWFAALILAGILLIVFGIYKYQIKQHKEFEEQKNLIQRRFEETKMEALLAQMNPHFIFNAMNSIQNYIMDNDIDNATVFLGDFARLIRLNLDHCTKPSILLIEEIEYLQSYIRVENTRLNDSVKVIFDIDPSIDTYDVEIPTMLLQTFVENVFVHAFPTGVINPTLKLSFHRIEEDTLECRIEDNGVGISSKPENNFHNSKGVKLVKERLALLGYDINEAIKIKSEKDKGTRVVIMLKN